MVAHLGCRKRCATHGYDADRKSLIRSVEVQVPKTLTKSDLVDAIASGAGIPKTQADAALNALVETVVINVTKGNTVRVPGLGSWKRTNRKARTGRNPQTGKPVKIPARKAPTFGASATFKDAVNGTVKKKAPAKKKPAAKKAPAKKAPAKKKK